MSFIDFECLFAVETLTSSHSFSFRETVFLVFSFISVKRFQLPSSPTRMPVGGLYQFFANLFSYPSATDEETSEKIKETTSASSETAQIVSHPTVARDIYKIQISY